MAAIIVFRGLAAQSLWHTYRNSRKVSPTV
jgi:hypothetical protein